MTNVDNVNVHTWQQYDYIQILVRTLAILSELSRLFPSRQMPEYLIKLGHVHFLPNPIQVVMPIKYLFYLWTVQSLSYCQRR
jgi:hypothetical protein